MGYEPMSSMDPRESSDNKISSLYSRRGHESDEEANGVTHPNESLDCNEDNTNLNGRMALGIQHLNSAANQVEQGSILGSAASPWPHHDLAAAVAGTSPLMSPLVFPSDSAVELFRRYVVDSNGNCNDRNDSSHRRRRGEKKPVPEEMKDSKYVEKRKRNNVAAKKSRDNKKQTDETIAKLAEKLEQERELLINSIVTNTRIVTESFQRLQQEQLRQERQKQEQQKRKEGELRCTPESNPRKLEHQELSPQNVKHIAGQGYQGLVLQGLGLPELGGIQGLGIQALGLQSLGSQGGEFLLGEIQRQILQQHLKQINI